MDDGADEGDDGINGEDGDDAGDDEMVQEDDD